MAPLMFAKWWKLITKKNSVTSLMFIFIFKKMDKVYNNLKDYLIFKKKSYLGTVYRFKVKAIIIIFKKNSLGFFFCFFFFLNFLI